MADRDELGEFRDAGEQRPGLTRRQLLAASASVGALAMLSAAGVPAWGQMGFDNSQAALLRVKIVTIGASDPHRVADAYVQWLDYHIRDSGTVSPAMAASWGAPRCAHRAFFMLSSAGYPDRFIRVVGIDPVPGFTPWTSAGWNGFEFIVDDVHTLYDSLKGSPFHPLKPPYAPVKAFPTIFSMDVVGPAGEILFLESDSVKRENAYLPQPRGKVGRPHLAWVSGPEILTLRDWYADSFSMKKLAVQAEPVPGAPDGVTKPNTILMMQERGNSIQFDGMPTQVTPRPHGAGQLPPGNAMASFNVASLDALPLHYLKPPQALYGPNRAATIIDPNGNRVELIEDAAPTPG